MRLHPDFDFSGLTADERVRLALALWESLDEATLEATLEETAALSAEQGAELDRRVADMERDGSPGMPWADVVAQARAAAARDVDARG